MGEPPGFCNQRRRQVAGRSQHLSERGTELSSQQAAEQIERDFHDLDVSTIAREIARLLAECLAIMVATTGIGALLGGVAGFFGGLGVGAAPAPWPAPRWARKRASGSSLRWA